MDLLVHVIVTSIAAMLSAVVLGDKSDLALRPRINGVELVTSQVKSVRQGFSSRLWDCLYILGKYADIRILVIGSMLPDIIDKPLGLYFLKNVFNSGRIFAHTLLFLILLIAIGAILYTLLKKTWMLVLSFGTFTHLVLDRMWNDPRTLFWPLLGVGFPRNESMNWLKEIMQDLVTNPATFIPETIGLIILVCFTWFLARNGQLRHILMKGKIRTIFSCSDNELLGRTSARAKQV